MEMGACVCDHGFERSDLCAEIIIIIIIITVLTVLLVVKRGGGKDTMQNKSFCVCVVRRGKELSINQSTSQTLR